MARIRSVKPELRTSLTVAEWPREVRYFWVLLWGFLDDYGRGVDKARLIQSDCFPIDEDLTPTIIDRWLGMFEEAGSLCRYEVDGRRYLHATKWTHQKISHPTNSKHPPCSRHFPEEFADWCADNPPELGRNSGTVPEPIGSESGTVQELFAPDQGSKGAREQGSRFAGGGAAAPGSIPEPKPETEGQRVNRLARVYTDRASMSNFNAVAGVVRKAVRADVGFTDEQITAALSGLVADGRSVTTETLRIALEGTPTNRGDPRRAGSNPSQISPEEHLNGQQFA